MESRTQGDRQEITRFFDKLAVDRDAHIYANPVIAYEQEVRSATVVGMLKLEAGNTVLDIGCGNARDIDILVRAGGRVTGVDISEGMVAEARRTLAARGVDDVTLEVGDATTLKYPDGSFDRILCSEVIEHIPEAQRAVAEMWRLLKPGGRIVFSTPNRYSWYGFERYVIWQFLLRRSWNHPCDEWGTRSELRRLVESAGFVTAEQTGACYVPGFLVTYFVMPRVVQKFLVAVVRRLEPLLRRVVPGLGYMVCLGAVKPER